MLVEAIVTKFFDLISFIVDKLPNNAVATISEIGIPDFIHQASCFFPMDLMLTVVTLFVTWYAIFMAWAIIEWVYKKIPGVS